ncbi:hypothetical protein V8C37DRAFT_392303 [Trichoderma ceciliae]
MALLVPTLAQTCFFFWSLELTSGLDEQVLGRLAVSRFWLSGVRNTYEQVLLRTLFSVLRTCGSTHRQAGSNINVQLIPLSWLSPLVSPWITFNRPAIGDVRNHIRRRRQLECHLLMETGYLRIQRALLSYKQQNLDAATEQSPSLSLNLPCKPVVRPSMASTAERASSVGSCPRPDKSISDYPTTTRGYLTGHVWTTRKGETQTRRRRRWKQVLIFSYESVSNRF